MVTVTPTVAIRPAPAIALSVLTPTSLLAVLMPANTSQYRSTQRAESWEDGVAY